MAARVRLLQLAIALVNLTIAALAVTSVYPFPSGDFNVDLPKSTDITWTYTTDGVVHVVAPYSVDNGGFYDVKNLVLNYSVTNDTGYALAGQDITIGDIPAGQVTSSTIDFQFNILQMYEDGAQWMVFHDNLLMFYIEVSCLYTAELVKFEAQYQVSADWVAPIKDYGARNDTWGYAETPLGRLPDSANITYWLETSRILAPFSPATMEVVLRGGSTVLSSWTDSVPLGTAYRNTVMFAIDPAVLSTLDLNSHFFLDVHISVAGFEKDQTLDLGSISEVLP